MRDSDDVTVLELLRRRSHLSQADVASAIGVPQCVVSYFEHGLRPNAEQLRALCELFGVEEPSKLLERRPLPVEDVPPPPDMGVRIRAMAAAREREKREKKR